ncbi:MAG: cytochrome c peroxidase [Verrucomicrobiota bacterium]|nr:cytochrome c peroxidase [Verrucomicrobiota bacterium]
MALRSGAVTLDLDFRPTWDAKPLELEALRHETGAGELLSVTRLSALLSGAALETADGNWVEVTPGHAWIDLASGRLRWTLNSVPPAQYRALRFWIGPDSVENHADPAKRLPDDPLSPGLNGLHWDWQGGYIFMALEGRYRSGTGPIAGYSMHFARDPRRTQVSLATSLDLRQDRVLRLDWDLASLFRLPRPISLARDGHSTHSREQDALADALGKNLPLSFRAGDLLDSLGVAEKAVPPVVPKDLPPKYTPHRFAMAGTFPIPPLPRDNPLIEERIALGRRLFQETALSADRSISCASCHAAASGFSDSRRFSPGVQGQLGTRQSMALANLAWKREFFWDGRARSLRDQVLMPIQDPTEMVETLESVVGKLSGMPEYPVLFENAFGTPRIDAERIALALEQFVLTLTHFRSRFDLSTQGKASLSDQERRGLELFMTENEPRMGQRGADCFHCHGGPLFTDHQFHDNGLDLVPSDPGRARVTGRNADRGKFVTPTLRNIAQTAPYMHDGRFQTLEAVVRHYSEGVQVSPNLDPNLAKHAAGGLHLSLEDQSALVAFLKTLSDPVPESSQPKPERPNP